PNFPRACGRPSVSGEDAAISSERTGRTGAALELAPPIDMRPPTPRCADRAPASHARTTRSFGAVLREAGPLVSIPAQPRPCRYPAVGVPDRLRATASER